MQRNLIHTCNTSLIFDSKMVLQFYYNAIFIIVIIVTIVLLLL